MDHERDNIYFQLYNQRGGDFLGGIVGDIHSRTLTPFPPSSPPLPELTLPPARRIFWAIAQLIRIYSALGASQ